MEDSRISPLRIKKELIRLIGKQTTIAPELGPQSVNRYNLIGKSFSPTSPLEKALGVDLSPDERALAYRCLKELENVGIVAPSYSDLGNPEDWLVLTEKGKRAGKTGAVDELDLRLLELTPDGSLVDRRQGAGSAVHSGEPDSVSQAAFSARELLRQVLDIRAPRTGVKQESTLKARVGRALELREGPKSSSEKELLEARVVLFDKLHGRLSAVAKSTQPPSRDEAIELITSAEGILRTLLGVTQ